MATVQVKLGFLILLVAAAVAGATAYDLECLYVVDVQTASSTSLPGAEVSVAFSAYGSAKADAPALWSRTKGPSSSNFAAFASYTFVVYDSTAATTCTTPCRLSLQLVSEGAFDSWMPLSIRIQSYDNTENDKGQKTFTVFPRAVVNSPFAPVEVGDCPPQE